MTEAVAEVEKRAVPASLRHAGFQRLLQQCIHCGLCLQACPTYAVFGTEMDAPRGRIALMRAAAEGRISLDGRFREHIERCLACRACETACPSGVRYAALVEEAQKALEETRSRSRLERLARRLVLRALLPETGRLRMIARLLYVYQVAGLGRLVPRLSFLPARLRAMAALLPPLRLTHRDYRRPAPAIGIKQGTVAFFHGCVQEAFLSPINEATVQVLRRNGYEVHFPKGQTCCGAAPLHLGERHLAQELARRNVDAFLGVEYDAIVNNAGGCGAMLKEYGRLLSDEPAYEGKVAQFVAKVRDAGEFLADHLNVPPRGVPRCRVTYADSCHLRHAQKVVRQPRDLLRAIPGVEIVELKQPDRCCGSAGVYNILRATTAQAVLEAKLADIAATGADTVVTGNAGCHMQLTAGVRRAGIRARVVHLMELLDQSYRLEAGGRRGTDDVER